MIPANLTGDQIDDSLLKSIAVEGFVRELGLDESDEAYLLQTIEVRDVQPGATVIQEGDIDVFCFTIYLSIIFLKILYNFRM